MIRRSLYFNFISSLSVSVSFSSYFIATYNLYTIPTRISLPQNPLMQRIPPVASPSISSLPFLLISLRTLIHSYSHPPLKYVQSHSPYCYHCPYWLHVVTKMKYQSINQSLLSLDPFTRRDTANGYSRSRARTIDIVNAGSDSDRRHVY
jgi:hypothetical protein